MKRTAMAVIGVLGAVVGLATMLEPGLARAFGVDRTMVLGIGALALLQGYLVVRSRRGTPLSIAETADPETEQELHRAGDDFDDLLSRLDRARRPRRSVGQARATARVADRVKARLERAAVATITRKWGCTREQARAALEAGDWTDDPLAAAYFTGDLRGVSLRRRVRYVLASEGRDRRRAARAAEAIADLAATDPDDLDVEVGS